MNQKEVDQIKSRYRYIGKRSSPDGSKCKVCGNLIMRADRLKRKLCSQECMREFNNDRI